MKLIIIIPALNEETSIQGVIRRIPQRIDGIDSICVVVIDDGSRDRTAELARDAGALVVSHGANQGVGRSFQTGLKTALGMGADILVNIDADGQFEPEEIPLLVRPILAGEADFVAANRFKGSDGIRRRPENMSAMKYWGNQVMAGLIGVMSGQSFDDVSCGFRAYSRETMLMLNLTGAFTYTQESFLDLSNKRVRIQSVPVSIHYYKDRKSRVSGNLFTYTYRTLKIILRAYRDYKPLQFFSYLAVLPFAVGLACMLFSGAYYLSTGSFTPYKFVGISGIYLFSLGLLLFIIGFLADMFMRVRQNQEQILYYEKYRHYQERKDR